MNRYLNLFVFLPLLLCSCDGYLDVSPSDFLTREEYFLSAEELQVGLTGAYSSLESNFFGGANLTLTPGLWSDNTSYSSFLNADYQEISINQVATTNTDVTYFWLQAYQTINQANLILESLELIDDPGLTPGLAARIRGEALFLRGLSHFEMVRFYAKPYGPTSGSDPGIPIMTNAITALDEVALPARATVSEVYRQAAADLAEARSLLPGRNERGRASRFAATGYLAKIAFQQRQYEEAAQLAGSLLEGPFSLMPHPETFFREEGSAEEVWAVLHSRQSGEIGALHSIARNLFLNNSLVISGFNEIVTVRQQDMLQRDTLQAIDLRFSTLTDSIPNAMALASTKYEDGQGGDDAPILRLAEFFLMRAEALARTEGINPESVELINAIRHRALRIVDQFGNEIPGGEAYILFSEDDFSGAEELIEAIIRERRVELLLEGNRFHDLMRLERGVAKPTEFIPFGDPRLTWPIPQREIDANPKLVQNEGY